MEREQHHRRIDNWIEKLERQADELINGNEHVEGIQLEELTAKERFELALKCLGHTQRFIMLRQQLAAEKPQGQTNIILDALMRRMRGELTNMPDMDGQADE